MNYETAPTLDALLAFGEAWQAEVGRDHAAARTATRAACPGRETYIWRVVASSAAPNPSRAPFSASTYYTCGQGGLGRADDLNREHVVPALDALVRDGSIVAWRWLAHVMAGAFNRLLVMDAASSTDAVRAWGRLGDHLDDSVLADFDAVCPSHQDYVFRILPGSR